MAVAAFSNPLGGGASIELCKIAKTFLVPCGVRVVGLFLDRRRCVETISEVRNEAKKRESKTINAERPSLVLVDDHR